MSRIQAQQTRRARRLRQDSTYAEDRIWQRLRGHRLGGWKWRRQHPFGPFILDFVCLRAGLVVELDGEAHDLRGEYDARRTGYLQQQGLRVLRFTNDEVATDIDSVCARILEACGPTLPLPPRSGEGEGWGEGGAAFEFGAIDPRLSAPEAPAPGGEFER